MAENESHGVGAMLAAWRESGADRIDPVRFRAMEALARRAQRYAGPARRVLDARLAALADEYGDTVRRAAGKAGKPDSDPGAGPDPTPGALAALVARIRANAPADDTDGVARLGEYFRETWVRVRARRELRHSVERVPENAGPLNSSHLVQRSLSLMGEVSPDYLQHFLAYVDALSSLERLQGAARAAGAAAREAVQGGGVRKVVRGKPRKDGAKAAS